MFDMSERDYLWPDATKELPDCLNTGWDISRVVAIKHTGAGLGHHSLLGPKVKTFY